MFSSGRFFLPCRILVLDLSLDFEFSVHDLQMGRENNLIRRVEEEEMREESE